MHIFGGCILNTNPVALSLSVACSLSVVSTRSLAFSCSTVIYIHGSTHVNLNTNPESLSIWRLRALSCILSHALALACPLFLSSSLSLSRILSLSRVLCLCRILSLSRSLLHTTAYLFPRRAGQHQHCSGKRGVAPPSGVELTAPSQPSLHTAVPASERVRLQHCSGSFT